MRNVWFFCRRNSDCVAKITDSGDKLNSIQSADTFFICQQPAKIDAIKNMWFIQHVGVNRLKPSPT